MAQRERHKRQRAPVLSRTHEANNRIQGLSAFLVSTVTSLRVSLTISGIADENDKRDDINAAQTSRTITILVSA